MSCGRRTAIRSRHTSVRIQCWRRHLRPFASAPRFERRLKVFRPRVPQGDLGDRRGFTAVSLSPQNQRARVGGSDLNVGSINVQSLATSEALAPSLVTAERRSHSGPMSTAATFPRRATGILDHGVRGGKAFRQLRVHRRLIIIVLKERGGRDVAPFMSAYNFVTIC